MRIPYVIDNQTHRLADVLNELLSHFQSRSLDIATAYFTVSGFQLIREGLQGIGSLRLLLGAEPKTGEHIGLRPDAQEIPRQLVRDLEQAPFSEETLRLVEDLIAFLRRDSVEVRLVEKGFLHAKCYLIYGDKPSGQRILFDRFQPLIGIVGSSNFTGPGLTSNRELNLAHRVLLEEDEAVDTDAGAMVRFLSDARASNRITERNRRLLKSEVGARAITQLVTWFDRAWEDARPFGNDLIDLLDASKFGQKEYTPYQVYMKALYEYFRDDLETEPEQTVRSAVELAEFQEDAVKRARKILSRYDGVMIADSVGLGKTWIGKKLLEDYAYHMREKALVICPASLRQMWTDELGGATIAATIVSQEELGQIPCPAVEQHGDADVILIDESHNFRNSATQRYDNLERLVSMNGGRGRDGQRKKMILVTATPINNDLLDLYQQINLFTRGDRGYFAAIGIGDLHRYFLRARRESSDNRSGAALFNLLEEVVVRRTRPFIRKAYPEATIRGERIRFPERRLKTERYNLEATYQGIYEGIVAGIESLHLAPYALESYKRAGVAVDEFEQGRGEALVGIFKSRYLKRLESSIQAFRISIRRALEFQKTFESYLLDGKVLDSRSFHKAMQFLAREDEEDDATPTSRAAEMDETEDVRGIIEELGTVNPSGYDLRKLHEAVQHDIEVLGRIWLRVKDIGPAQDLKLARLRELLAGPLKGKKVLLFSYYLDTVRYLWRELGSERGDAFRRSIGSPNIRQMHSGVDPLTRANVIVQFAPEANRRPEIAGTDNEIDILLSTDVLSEGQNLQDCAHLVNYDLHWNPVRMVQRAGRIDRIGAKFPVLYIHNMFPDAGLERLLRLVQRLTERINRIDQAGFLDASILGETVHPRNFNTLRRIRDEDGTIIEEEEQFGELASNEFLLRQLLDLLRASGNEMLESLPHGIHSGLVKPGAKGVFFYFEADRPGRNGRYHFWKYYDLATGQVTDNRYVIASLITCSPDTPRVVADVPIFEIQDKVIEDILAGQESQQALGMAPKPLDPFQQTVATTLQSFISHPSVTRQEVMDALRYLAAPLAGAQIKELRKAYQEFSKSRDPRELVNFVTEMMQRYGVRAEPQSADTRPVALTRDDLRLVCFDVLSG
jgi:SNF2 family DNA or RNA helicase